MSSPNQFHTILSDIKLFAMDVDGVLTRGDVIFTDDGRELKMFNSKDGHGIAVMTTAGIHVAWITGRKSEATTRRANELGVQHLHQGIKTKLPVMQTLIAELGIQPAQVLYMGDDTPDIPILQAVGFAACPSDAVDEVKRACHYTTKAAGGCGSVREVVDMVLRTHALGNLHDVTLPSLANPT